MMVPKRPLDKVLLFALICFLAVNSLRAQQLGTPFPPFKTMAFKDFTAPNLQLDVAPVMMKTPIFSPHWQATPFNSQTAGEVLSVMAALNNFANSPTPFFCRIEENIEKSARFPVRVRLGDVNYVDRLEQKKDWELGN
jgi:hypothetical protein